MKALRHLLFALLATAAVLTSGCGGTNETAPADAPASDVSDTGEEALDLSYLPAEDQTLALEQKFCPVGGKDALLGSGGMKAVKVNVEGRDVFLCCEGCEETLRANPEKYFAILDGTDAPAESDAEADASETDATEPAKDGS